eukprot:TRINITY_DN11969_c0_g1_i8.p1 TRINITY_DN11969_c0_g1~~TRINITY_DN11969_c0_g1_i8.p1  ORF type:complete len:277 (-),score=48.17 TRINITY_DN11969_c0_g1_i8:110-940(-)
MIKLKSLYILCILSICVAGDPQNTQNGGITRSEQELLGKYLLQRLLGNSDQGGQEAVARIAERAAFDDLLSSASVVYPEYGGDATIEDVDYEYSESDIPVHELKQPSQTISTIVPAPTSHKDEDKYCVDCKSMQSPTSSRFAMPLTTLGVKKYYIGIFFKANWARSAQYCRYHGMHLASVNTEEEQNNIEEHIQSLGFGHEHFWTSGTDQAEEGKFFWMSTGKPLTYENWNTGEPNNYEYEGGELEHCLELWNRDGKGLKWNDTPCSFETFFICEV